MPDQPTRPSAETRAAERDGSAARPRPPTVNPTPEEERLAETHDVDPEAAAHEKEMNERGAKQKGEGRLP